MVRIHKSVDFDRNKTENQNVNVSYFGLTRTSNTIKMCGLTP